MQIGINTLSISKELRADLPGTADYLRSIGCSYIESMTDLGAKEETIEFYARRIGGRSGWDMAGIRSRVSAMHEAGMDVQGVFLFDECLEENLDEIGALLRELGIRYGVLSFMNYGKTLESVDEKNRAGQACWSSPARLRRATDDPYP